MRQSSPPFITPSAPVLRREPPRGPLWQHELKFDGFRVQLHKRGRDALIFSRSGHDITARYPALRDILAAVPRRSFVIDAELVACHPNGHPDFIGLLKRSNPELCLWCFDLLSCNSSDCSRAPLHARRDRLKKLIAASSDPALRFSEAFSDPVRLLATAESLLLEGIVSKRIDQPYRSGRNPMWVKVKTAAWKQENSWRGRFFHRPALRQ